MKVIELKNIKRVYKMGETFVNAVNGITLEVEKGEYIAIMGPSGSGKSTLLHIIGFLDKPTEGRYIFKGKDVTDFSDDELAEIRNREIGFVFQAFHLIPRIKAIDNVELPLIYSGIPHNKRKEIALKYLREVGLEKRAEHYPTELSGGEMQRVAIARALVTGAEVLLADEPTGNLDTKSGNEIMNIFDELNKSGKTIIVVTHDPEVAKRAKRIIYLRDGEIEKEELK